MRIVSRSLKVKGLGLCSAILLSGFGLPLVPVGYTGFPVNDNWESRAYMLCFVVSYLLLLVVMSLHAVNNPRLASGARLGWIFMNTTGWGAVVYFAKYYWRSPSGPSASGAIPARLDG